MPGTLRPSLARPCDSTDRFDGANPVTGRYRLAVSGTELGTTLPASASPDPVSTRSKGERTRAATVAAAVDLFGSTGYAGASVAAVARRIGVTPSAVFAHFRSKEELYDAAVAADLGAAFRAALVGADRTATVTDVVTSVLVSLPAAFADHPLAARALRDPRPGSTPALVASAEVRHLVDQLRSDLRRDVTRSLVYVDDEDRAVAGIESLVLLASLAVVTGTATSADPRWVDGLVWMVASALGGNRQEA